MTYKTCAVYFKDQISHQKDMINEKVNEVY